jgi:hypothetical protein
MLSSTSKIRHVTYVHDKLQRVTDQERPSDQTLDLWAASLKGGSAQSSVSLTPAVPRSSTRGLIERRYV